MTLQVKWQHLTDTHLPPCCAGVPPSWARKPGGCLDLQELATRQYGEGADVATLQLFRRKLLSHHDSVRPAYYGSFSRSRWAGAGVVLVVVVGPHAAAVSLACLPAVRCMYADALSRSCTMHRGALDACHHLVLGA